MTEDRKDPYDKSSTARSSRLATRIRQSGGAVFTVRIPTAEQLAQLDALVAAGVGASRNEVILNLVAEKVKQVLK